nr:Chain C, PRO-ARG-SER-PHE-LEU-VAL-ARG-ARG-LYS [Homo sapiens]
PRSFLVRRK